MGIVGIQILILEAVKMGPGRFSLGLEIGIAPCITVRHYHVHRPNVWLMQTNFLQDER